MMPHTVDITVTYRKTGIRHLEKQVDRIVTALVVREEIGRERIGLQFGLTRRFGGLNATHIVAIENELERMAKLVGMGIINSHFTES